MKDSELSKGSVTPMRPLTALMFELSFWNWPLLSRCEPVIE